MRYILVLLLITTTFICGQNKSSSSLEINLLSHFGYTIVDVGKAMEIPDFSDITKEGLNDWDQFGYKGIVQVFFNSTAKTSLGIEGGVVRLYYWEERYKTSMGYDRWRSGVIWTWNVAALLRMRITEQYYVFSGAGAYTFFNGSGTAVGFPIGFGHNIKFSDRLTIPIEFRTDIVLGDATPIAISGGIGILFRL